jgi:hypothetical protein
MPEIRTGKKKSRMDAAMGEPRRPERACCQRISHSRGDVEKTGSVIEKPRRM